ncbi:hypothetical protein [Corynebacterium lubricantis]|uniref:hypothetical protein n=1 Tax=Corynebacterium lubricantis TaxID=541095 RepID=UPI000381DEDE|nr:hypothetical protein [Corynebacterium lubricantis]
MESLARFRLIEANLPQVKSIEYQAKIQITDERGSRHTFYADQLINGFLISELDGRSKYDGTYGDIPEEVRQKERDRERLLLNAGFPLVRHYYSALRLDAQGSCAYVRNIQKALRRYAQPRQAPSRVIQL